MRDANVAHGRMSGPPTASLKDMLCSSSQFFWKVYEWCWLGGQWVSEAVYFAWSSFSMASQMLKVIAPMILLSAPITLQRAVQRQVILPPTLMMPKAVCTWNEGHIQPHFQSQNGMDGGEKNDVWRLALIWFRPKVRLSVPRFNSVPLLGIDFCAAYATSTLAHEPPVWWNPVVEAVRPATIAAQGPKARTSAIGTTMKRRVRFASVEWFFEDVRDPSICCAGNIEEDDQCPP